MKNKKIMPKLRFKEFGNEGQWDLKKLNDVVTFVKEKIPIDEIKLLNYFSTENILSDFAGVTKASKLPTSGSFVRFIKNDMLISNIRPYLRKIWMANIDGGASNDIIVLRASARINHTYLSFVLKKDDFINFMMKGAKGVKMPRGDISLMKDYLLGLPSFQEQQKIADCLSSLDDLITAHTKKLDHLKKHKKGLMQQLFPAEGETVPKLRFPEFKSQWDTQKLDKLYDFKSTNSYSRDDLNYKEGLVKNIHYGDIHTKFNSWFFINREKVPFINSEINLDKIKEENYCIEGDLIFADASEDLADIGKCIEIIDLNNQKVLSGLHTILARSIKPVLEKGFPIFLLKADVTRKQIQREAQGTKVLGISTGRLSKINLYFPEDKKEQKKIADCLSSLDDLITAQTQKLEALKLHKKGLMQQLFPTADEVDSE